MNWDDVRFFLAAQRAQILTGAARELGVDQSTVSRRLVVLEKSLAIRLFERTSDGLAITQGGTRILPTALAMEASALELQRQAGGDDAELSGSVRVAVSEALARFLVPKLGGLRASYPDIRLELTVGRNLVSLERREADVAVRLLPTGSAPGEPRAIARRLGEAAIGLYGSREYIERVGRPASHRELGRLDFVDYDLASPSRPGAAWIADNLGSVPIVMRCESMMAILSAIHAGHGVGALFSFIASSEPSLVELASRLERWQIWLVVHPDLRNKARIRVVLEALTRIVEESSTMLDPAGPLAG